MKVPIGTRIAARRDELGLSRAKLGRAADVDSMAIYRWETGRVQPSLQSLMALAKVMGVSLDWLVYGRSNESSAPRINSRARAAEATVVDE